MGYTHYWVFNKKPNAVEYARAIKDISKIARACKEFLSGYSAHVPPHVYGGAMINGIGDDRHEDFTLRERPADVYPFNFCKTAAKPYDIAVVASLIVLKHRLGDDISVSSDGGARDWNAGLKLAKRVTGLKLKNPLAGLRRTVKVKAKVRDFSLNQGDCFEDHDPAKSYR